MNKKSFLSLIILLILASALSLPFPLIVGPSSKATLMKEYMTLSRSSKSSSSPDLTVTSISFSPETPESGETVTITATIKNTGDTASRRFYVSFYVNTMYEENEIGRVVIAYLKSGASKDVSVDWTAVEGTCEIIVYADSTNLVSEASEDNNISSETISVGSASPQPPAIEYELFIEVDYIVTEKHNATPNPEVLNYIHGYYYQRGINVTFILDDEINATALSNLGVNPTDGINDTEFWIIEEAYNDELYYDDQANDRNDTDIDGYDAEYTLKEKWLLFGSMVEDQPQVVGYCYVVAVGRINLDFIAGNYMFIADEAGDEWASSNGIGSYGAEAVVVMHEMGHSIGIGKAHRFRGEIYCDDPECVMAKLSTANADNYQAWFYCNDCWKQKNLEYYAVAG